MPTAPKKPTKKSSSNTAVPEEKKEAEAPQREPDAQTRPLSLVERRQLLEKLTASVGKSGWVVLAFNIDDEDNMDTRPYCSVGGTGDRERFVSMALLKKLLLAYAVDLRASMLKKECDGGDGVTQVVEDIEDVFGPEKKK